MITITKTIWLSPGYSGKVATIGIVLVHLSEVDKYKAYIGVGEGVDPTIDAKNIAETGGRFPLELAQAAWPDIRPEDWYKN